VNIVNWIVCVFSVISNNAIKAKIVRDARKRRKPVIDLDDFIKQFMEVYSFKMNQTGKKRCKYCRFYNTRLSEQESEGLKEFASNPPECYKNESEFGICRKCSKMANKRIKDKLGTETIITAHNGYCTLFRLSILKWVKSVMRGKNADN
jgi:hypothetical protein